MATQREVGLRELIQQIKTDLLAPESADGDLPLFSVDSINLELKVAVKNEGKAGLHVHVLQAGGSRTTDAVQTVKVTLSPLLTKEELIQLYRQQNPAAWAKVKDSSVRATLKGRE